jgi:hydroxyacylglutathione hydrolase
MLNFHIPSETLLFTGDTLFAMGCGRLFEGDAATMWASLCKLMALDDETVIYCGHEYTAANADFALSVDPDNEALMRRVMAVRDLRAAGQPTIPTMLALEKITNPFLRAGDPAIRAHLGMSDADDVDVFAEIRRRKDSF